METFFRVTDPLWGESTGDRWIPLTKSQWRGAWISSLIYAWTNGWTNNGDAGDLRGYRTHYDDTVMILFPGIGFYTALDLAWRNARVIMTGRDPGKLKRAVAEVKWKTGNSEVLAKVLDVSLVRSIRSFVEDFRQTERRLDILINNAGIGGRYREADQLCPMVHDDVIKWITFSALLAFCAGNPPAGHQWIPLTKASDVELCCFFYLRLNKRLRKQSWGWRFETPSRSLWSHCNVNLGTLILAPYEWSAFT